MMNEDDLIPTLRQRLRWHVEHRQGSTHDLEIVADPSRRTHTITLPANGPPRPYEYAHELAHAYLAETVDPQFAGHTMAAGTAEADMRGAAPLLRCSADWYVDGLLYSLAPEIERRDTLELYEAIREQPPCPEEIAVGLLLAEAARFAGIALAGGDLVRHAVADALLSERNDTATVRRLERTVRKVAVAAQAPFRLHLEWDAEASLRVWRIGETR